MEKSIQAVDSRRKPRERGQGVLDFILKEWGAPVRPLLISEDSEVGEATRRVKKAGITGLGCKVSCVPALMKGPHWTHSDSDKLTELPCRPTGSSLGSPFPSLSSSLAVLFPQTLRRGPSSGLVPCPSPDICGAHCLVSFRSLPKCLLSESPRSPICWTSPPPPLPPSTCLTPSHGSLVRHPT